jgi:hypothetical protein
MEAAFIDPVWIPLVGAIGGTLMIVAIVGIVFAFKARAMELKSHEDLRIREMEHLKKMRELEIELEKTKARSALDRSA